MNSMKHLLKDAPQGKPGPQLSQKHQLRSPSSNRTEVRGQPCTQSSGLQVLETQDWVCKPPESRGPRHRWSLSIDERRQLSSQGGWERRGAAECEAHYQQDILQLVAQLVSEDVDKDVLIPHPRRSTESAHALHAFLARSAPFWHNVRLAAQASRWPPS